MDSLQADARRTSVQHIEDGSTVGRISDALVGAAIAIEPNPTHAVDAGAGSDRSIPPTFSPMRGQWIDASFSGQVLR
jgi:hypothetical protein